MVNATVSEGTDDLGEAGHGGQRRPPGRRRLQGGTLALGGQPHLVLQVARLVGEHRDPLRLAHDEVLEVAAGLLAQVGAVRGQRGGGGSTPATPSTTKAASRGPTDAAAPWGSHRRRQPVKGADPATLGRRAGVGAGRLLLALGH